MSRDLTHPAAEGLPIDIPASEIRRDELMAVCAVRYCLGRQTYIVHECAVWLAAQWPRLSPETQVLIRRDIEEAIADDDQARAREVDRAMPLPLGMNMDRDSWVALRRLWLSPVNDPATRQPPGHKPAGARSRGARRSKKAAR